MTAAHPESVVGRLRAKVDAYDVECSRPAPHRAQDRFNAQTALEWESCDAAPALLAALERVWADCHDARSKYTDELSECHDGIRAMANGTIAILAPLFESTENPT